MSYRVAVDIGGTFTDCAVVSSAGGRALGKALTTPVALEQGVLDAVGVAAMELGSTRGAVLADADMFVHGTTQATNAILTRSGARTGLITTLGHEDSLIIGRVYSKVAGLPERDLVHASRVRKPEPIVPRSLIRGVPERIDRDGDIVVALDEAAAIAAIDELVAMGVDALAVSFLWSCVNPVHERRVAELLAERAPGLFVALSSDIAPVIGEYERTATTAMTAYVGPRVASYLRRLEERLQQEGLAHPLLIMQASGGLTSVEDAAGHPLATLDSGPTGGILGSQYLGRLMNEENLICTDVGGTSFDVGLVLQGRIPLDPEPVIAQYSLRTPKVLVRSIGSGGGSIAWLDHGGLLRVGPQSAGSSPGPACYGLGGGDATVTDADVVLGYVGADSFLGGRMHLDLDLALAALARIGRALGMEAEEVAIGIFDVINAQMADLILRSTLEQGHDPRTCVLVAYGGAGPTHAAFYGHDIGAKAIAIPADSTVFSAEGMLTCDMLHTAEVSHLVATPFTDEDIAGLRARFAGLEQQVRRQFEREGARLDEVVLSRMVGARFRHQVHGLEVSVDQSLFDAGSARALVSRFTDRYSQVYGEGAILANAEIEIDLHRVIGTRTMPSLPIEARTPDADGAHVTAMPKGERPVYFRSIGQVTTAIYEGGALRPGDEIVGPAIIERMGDGIVVPPQYGAVVDPFGSVLLAQLTENPPDGS
jgi:N-methylhydantoinase A